MRAVLNYGHTLAHALETATGHALLHGEAVAIGLVFAAQLAAMLERIATRRRRRAPSPWSTRLGLPDRSAPRGAARRRPDRAHGAATRSRRGGLTFMLAGPNGIERVDDPDPAAVTQGARPAIGVEAN